MTALDIQEEMFVRTHEQVQAAGLQNVRFVQTGLGEDKPPQGYYDRVVLVTVLGEIPDQLSVLKEIFSALRPSSILSVTEVIFDPHFQCRETVLHVAQAAGFKEKNFFGKKLAYRCILINLLATEIIQSQASLTNEKLFCKIGVLFS